MKKITKAGCFTVLFTLICLGTAYAQKTAFSGKWVLNKEKTVLDSIPEWVLPPSLQVTVNNNGLSIGRTVLDEKMDAHQYTENLLFDGTEAETNVYNNIKRRTTMHLITGKNEFELHTKLAQNENDPGSGITENWSLTDDGNTLVLVRQVEQSNGLRYKLTAFYDKN